jgi:activating signal cointegrator complex subunit 3
MTLLYMCVWRRIIFLAGRLILTLYVMSDCYLGLDQQYDLQFDIIPANPGARENTGR